MIERSLFRLFYFLIIGFGLKVIYLDHLNDSAHDEIFIVILKGFFSGFFYVILDFMCLFLIFIDKLIYISELQKFVLEYRNILHPGSNNMLSIGSLLVFFGMLMIKIDSLYFWTRKKQTIAEAEKSKSK